MGVCIKSSAGVAIPTISIKNPMLKGVKDIDGDGYVFHFEAINWVRNRYYDTMDRVLGPLLSKCGVFNKEEAIRKIKGLRPQARKDIDAVSSEFGGCEQLLKEAAQKTIGICEHDIINSTVRHLAEQSVGGKGTLGIRWGENSGNIYSVRMGSPADRAGVKAGDKLISVDGVKLRESSGFVSSLGRAKYAKYVESLFQQGSSGKAGQFIAGLATLVVAMHTSLVKTCIGPCGSVAKVVIERRGKRMTLQLTR